MSTIVVACSAAIALLVAALGAWVTIVRLRTNVMYHGKEMAPSSQIAKAVRAHGNASEYGGMLIGLFILTGLVYRASPIETWVSALIALISISRYLGAIGFLTCATLEKIHPLKAFAAVVTYAGTVALAINLLLKI